MSGGWKYTPASSGDGSCGPDAGGVDGYVERGGGVLMRLPEVMWVRSLPPGYWEMVRTELQPAAAAGFGRVTKYAVSPPATSSTASAIPPILSCRRRDMRRRSASR